MIRGQIKELIKHTNESVLNLEVEAFDFRVDSETFELADPFSTSGTTGSWQITTDRAILARGISRSSYFDVHEVRLSFLLETFLLDDFSEIKIPLQVAFLFGSFVDPLLVLPLSGFAFANLEALVVIELSHLVRILKEIFLKKPQFLLNDCSSLVLIDFPDCSSKAFVSAPVAGFRYCARH